MDSTNDILTDDSVENQQLRFNEKTYEPYRKNNIGGWFSAINSVINSPSHYATYDKQKEWTNESFFRSPSPEYNKIKLSAVSQMLLNLK